MALTREELKNANNNVMTVMENHIMSMVGCDRRTANLVANEVLDLDRDAEWLLNNEEPHKKEKTFEELLEKSRGKGNNEAN